MKIFRGRKGSGRHGRKTRQARAESIGSELSPSDQFEILVFNKPSFSLPGDHTKRRSKNSIMSYFSGDYDESTVSSITVEDYGGFYFSKHYDRSDASMSSWCCCSDTSYTHPNSLDNTTMTSGYGNSYGYNSVRDYSMYQPGIRTVDFDDRLAPSRRPKLRGMKSRSRSRGRRQRSASGDKSLFDTLSEDELEEVGGRRRQKSRRRTGRTAPWNRK